MNATPLRLRSSWQPLSISQIFARDAWLIHTTGNHFSQRLKAIVISEGPEWNDFLQLQLWILVVGAVKASEEDRHLFGAAIKSVLETLGIVTWYGAMNVVENFVWME
jgi:hypothetical protein